MLGDSRELFVSGRILRGDETVDSFRYRFDSLPAAAGAGARPLAFERRLGPGRYKLEVELEAPAAGSSFVGERELAVPSAPAAVSAAGSGATTLARGSAAVRGGRRRARGAPSGGEYPGA